MDKSNDTAILDLLAALWRQSNAVNNANGELRKEIEALNNKLATTNAELAALKAAPND